MNVNIFFFQIEKYKKSKRPCVFCGKYQAQLNRHIKLKHSDNKEGQETLKLPKVLRLKKFDMFRKTGILQENKERLKESSSNLLRERMKNNTGAEDLCEVMCDKCYGFFQKSYHSCLSKLCMLNFEVRPQALRLHFLKNQPADYDSYPDDFKSCIIGTMLSDDTGKICKVDKTILLFG